jgi:hypothetical protein
MHNNIDQKFIDILTKQLVTAAVPPKRITPWLIISRSRIEFEHYCRENGLNFHKRPFEAVRIIRPEHLKGRANLRDDLIVLGYPRDNRGEEMRDFVEAILAAQDREKKHV